jgi:hypothetical protein
MTTIEDAQKPLLGVGEWSEFKCVDKTSLKIFGEATRKLVGVNYTPVAVSQQVVAGMNYRFFCNTKIVLPHSLHGAAIVSVYKPLVGMAHITSVMPIHL